MKRHSINRLEKSTGKREQPPGVWNDYVDSRAIRNPSDIKRLLVSMPFFRLDYRFNCPLEYIFEQAAQQPSKGSKEFKTFDRYLKNAAKILQEDKTVAYVRSRMPIGSNDEKIYNLQNIDEFLRQLSFRNFKIDFLNQYLQEIHSLLLLLMATGDVDNIRHFSTTELNSLIFHLTKWRLHLEPTDRERLIIGLEKLLQDTHDTLLTAIDSGKPTVAQVDLSVSLAFFYIIAIELFEVGAHPSIIASQVTLWRRTGTSFWLSLPSRLRLNHALVTIQLLVRHYPLNAPFGCKSGFSPNLFEGIRDILAGARDSMTDGEYTYEKTVFNWFLNKLNQDLFVGLGYHEPAVLLRSLSAGEHGIVQDFAQICYSYRYPVTIERVYAFLGQFPTLELVKAAVRLLTQIRYIPLSRLGELVEDSLTSVIRPGQSSRVVPLGDLAGSTSIIRYLAGHSNRLDPLTKTSSVEEALRTTGDEVDLIFADDSCLSGTQSINTFKELIGERKLKPHHTKHADELDLDLIEKLRRRNIKFCFAVATDCGTRRVKSELATLGFQNVEVEASHLEVKDYKVFSPHFAWLWRNRKEMDNCKKFFQEVGWQLLRNRAKEKKWKPEWRMESALGFSDFQRMLIFEHNVPKTTLTALWETGKFKGKQWIPLFPGSD